LPVNTTSIPPAPTIVSQPQVMPTAIAEPFEFALREEQVIYAHMQTLDCQRVIAGQLLDINGSGLIDDDIRVASEMLELEGNGENPMGYALPGNDSSYGVSGWSMLVPHIDVSYMLWLERISTGEVISPTILVSEFSCENNLA